MHCFHRRFHLPTSMFLVVSLLLIGVLTGAESLPEPQVSDSQCRTEKDCFRHALLIAANPAHNFDDRLAHFRRVHAQFPASTWGKRAGLWVGKLLVETDPTQAISYLEKAQQDFPFLQDYIRVWIAHALRNSGASQEAAAMFESILKEEPKLL